MEAAVGGGNGFFLVRLAAQFAGALALLALCLAVVGLYGVVAYSAGHRTHEIGIRMALGAGRRSILSMVAGRATGLAVAGVVLGTLAALALTRLMTSLLFDVSPRDPLTYGLVIAALALVTVAACLVPARRATRVDPAVALRGE